MAAAYLNSPKWVKRTEEFFDQSDMNKDSFLSIEDFELWVDNIEKETKAAPYLIEKFRKANREYWVTLGLKPGVRFTKEQYVDLMSKFAAAEKAKYDEGKEPFFFKWIDAMFDVVDTSCDGYLQLDEYENMMKASNFSAGTAKINFDIIDTNHDGKLSRQELKEYNLGFWFFADDAKSAGMFGPKYE